jgi:hypothetical protein
MQKLCRFGLSDVGLAKFIDGTKFHFPEEDTGTSSSQKPERAVLSDAKTPLEYHDLPKRTKAREFLTSAEKEQITKLEC